MSDPRPTARLPRRPPQANEARAATATPIDLRDLIDRSRPDAERPCPRCATPSGRPGTSSAPETYVCGHCGRQWWVEPGAPWPDVLVVPVPTPER